MTGLALLGAGRIGKVHARAIDRTSGAQLVAVADVSAEAAAALAGPYGAAPRSIDQIEADASVDAVVICTPTNTHADLIERFAHAGKAIFCEKPVDLALSRVEACLAVVDACDARLMVGFNRRFDPHFTALKATIERGMIGDIEQVTITSRDPGPPPADYVKVSGGIFRDMTIHDFDMARWLVDEDMATVFATGSVLVDPVMRSLDDYDTATVVMTTPSGRQITILNSRRATYGYDQRIEVHGSKGMVRAENQRPSDIELATGEGFSKPALHDFFMTRYTEAYEAELTAFLSALAGDGALRPDGRDGLEALRLAEAAAQSARSGRVVEVVRRD